MKASRKVLVMLAAGASLTAMAPAFADGWDYEHGYGHWYHHEARVGLQRARLLRSAAGRVRTAPRIHVPPAPVYYRSRRVT